MANATILVETQVTITNTRGVAEKPITSSKSLTAQKEVYRQEIDIAAAATAIIWNPTVWTSFPFTAFSFLYISADVQVELEFTAGEGEATEELMVVTIEPDLPFMLANDATYRGHPASDAYAGTADVFDKIRAKNPSATAAAKLTLILFDAT